MGYRARQAKTKVPPRKLIADGADRARTDHDEEMTEAHEWGRVRESASPRDIRETSGQRLEALIDIMRSGGPEEQ